jgi:hypothetical protein
MSPFRPLAILAVCLVTAQLTTAAPPQTPALLTAAQKALGATPGGALKTLRLTGTEWASQGVFGGYTQDTEGPMEIRLALPDRFVMITLDQFGSDVSERHLGFAGPRTIMTRGGKPAEAPGYDVYNRKKAAELLLGLLGRY